MFLQINTKSHRVHTAYDMKVISAKERALLSILTEIRYARDVTCMLVVVHRPFPLYTRLVYHG